MEPFFTSKACPDLKAVNPLQAYIEPMPHPLTKLGGHSGKLLELLALGHWLTALDAQGFSTFALHRGVPFATSGDKRLREVRTELGNYEIAIQEEKVTDNGKPHKRWRVHPADLKRLQTYLGM